MFAGLLFTTVMVPQASDACFQQVAASNERSHVYHFFGVFENSAILRNVDCYHNLGSIEQAFKLAGGIVSLTALDTAED